MTDDERQRLMDFILEQQAATSVKLNQLSDDHKQLLDSHRRDSIRLDRDERVLKLMIGAGRQARRDLRETRQIARQNSEEIKALIDSQFLTQHLAREQGEFIKRLEETVARSSERTNQAIAELAGIVKQLAKRRNGEGNS